MIDINLPNIITIGLIALAATAAVKFGTKAAGINLAWL